MLNSSLNIRTGNFGIVPLSYLNAYVYVLLLFYIAQWLDRLKIKSSGKPLLMPVNCLAWVGRWSVIYVCTNHGALLVGKKLWVGAGFSAGRLLESYLEFATAMLIMAVIVVMVKKTALRKVFAI